MILICPHKNIIAKSARGVSTRTWKGEQKDKDIHINWL